MSPLEAAKKMIEHGCEETSDRWRGVSCYFCDGILDAGGDIWPATGHTADCPWLAMPQIVAALEGIVSDDLTAAELCETHAKLCGGTWPGCPMKHQDS